MENNIDQLITKVLNREASSEEIIRFSQWLSETESNRDEFRKIKSYWDSEVSFKHTLNPVLSLQRIRHKIRKEHKRRILLYAVSVAASLLVLPGIGFSFMKHTNNNPVEYYTYLTENNKINFTLDDGTKIYLNKNSKFVYTNRYDETDRSVKLEGEAYLEVHNNPEKPFVVEIGDARIKVLGTAFNVKTDGADIRATLTKGSIRFEVPGQQIILTPGQQLVYSDFSRKIEVSSVNTDKELIWMEGIMRHKNVLFSELMDDLMKQFMVQIVIDNERLKNSPVSMTGSFAEEQSLENILRVISISYPFSWKKRGNTYFIK